MSSGVLHKGHLEFLDNNISIVILAAGEARRFGGAKQLANVGGVPLLQKVVCNCLSVNDTTPVTVVLGANAELIRPRLELTAVRILNNEGWAEGIASSIRLAVTELQSIADALLFVAGDQPLVSRLDLLEMIRQSDECSSQICAAFYKGGLGIPALFPRQFYAQLLNLEGDRGAKRILLANNSKVIPVNMPSAAIDVDYVSDLAVLK